MGHLVRLSEMERAQHGIVTKVLAPDHIKRRLFGMGIREHSTIGMIRKTLFGNTMHIVLDHHTHLIIRQIDASNIWVRLGT